jgi:hypothetical protein
MSVEGKPVSPILNPDADTHPAKKHHVEEPKSKPKDRPRGS